MKDLYPAVLTVYVMGGLGAVGLLLANVRGAWAWLSAWVLLMAGFAWWNKALAWPSLAESLVYDVPWATVALVAMWTAVGASGVFRPARFLAVALGAACFGSLAACLGLVVAEPDAGRRARLVVAASGAALLTPWGSPASLALGGASSELTALGVVLALVGFTRGGAATRWSPPDWVAVRNMSLLLVWVVLLVWLMRHGGVPDFLATGLEGLSARLPGRSTLWLGTVASIVGSLVHPAGAALVGGLVVDHATQVRGTWALDALKVGLTVGAGLPALLLTRSRLSVGLPLWVLQVLIAVAFLAARNST